MTYYSLQESRPGNRVTINRIKYVGFFDWTALTPRQKFWQKLEPVHGDASWRLTASESQKLWKLRSLYLDSISGFPVLWLSVFSASSWTEGETGVTLKVLPWRHSAQCLAHSKHSISVRNSALGVLANPASLQQKPFLLNIRKILLLKHCLLKNENGFQVGYVYSLRND